MPSSSRKPMTLSEHDELMTSFAYRYFHEHGTKAELDAEFERVVVMGDLPMSSSSKFVPRWANDRERIEEMMALDDLLTGVAPPPAASGAEEIAEAQSAIMTQNMALKDKLNKSQAFLESAAENHDIDEYGWHRHSCEACQVRKFLDEVFYAPMLSTPVGEGENGVGGRPLSYIHPFPQPANKE